MEALLFLFSFLFVDSAQRAAQKSIAWLTHESLRVRLRSLHAHFQSSLELQCRGSALTAAAAVNNLSLRSHFSPSRFFSFREAMKKSFLRYAEGERLNVIIGLSLNSRKFCFILRRGWKRLKGCVFWPPSLCLLLARGREVRKRNLSIASLPIPLYYEMEVTKRDVVSGRNSPFNHFLNSQNPHLCFF